MLSSELPEGVLHLLVEQLAPQELLGLVRGAEELLSGELGTLEIIQT